jgi:hypothetical protein
MLESELSNLNCSDEISLSNNLDVVDAVDQVSNLVGLGHSQFRSINQILAKSLLKITYLLPPMLMTPTLLSGFC